MIRLSEDEAGLLRLSGEDPRWVSLHASDLDKKLLVRCGRLIQVIRIVTGISLLWAIWGLSGSLIATIAIGLLLVFNIMNMYRVLISLISRRSAMGELPIEEPPRLWQRLIFKGFRVAKAGISAIWAGRTARVIISVLLALAISKPLELMLLGTNLEGQFVLQLRSMHTHIPECYFCWLISAAMIALFLYPLWLKAKVMKGNEVEGMRYGIWRAEFLKRWKEKIVEDSQKVNEDFLGKTKWEDALDTYLRFTRPRGSERETVGSHDDFFTKIKRKPPL